MTNIVLYNFIRKTMYILNTPISSHIDITLHISTGQHFHYSGYFFLFQEIYKHTDVQ